MAIIQRYLEIDFGFIAKATQARPDPDFQGGEGAIAPLVPIDNAYEATIDTEASNTRRKEEAGKEVDQPVGAEKAGDEIVDDAEGEAQV